MNSSNSMELPPSTIKAILAAFRQCISPCQKINATQHHMIKLPFPVLSKCQTCGVFGTHIKLEFSATHNSLIWHQFLFDYLSNFPEFVWGETAQRGLMLERKYSSQTQSHCWSTASSGTLWWSTGGSHDDKSSATVLGRTMPLALCVRDLL